MKLLVDTCVFVDTFDQNSSNYSDSLKLLEELRNRNQLITMPAHAMFEILCTLNRLTIENRFNGPIFSNKMDYLIELIHIDDKFIDKYAMVEIPYIKAGDHIFVVVAKVNNYPLISSDSKMIEVCKKCGVNIYTPKEYFNYLINPSPEIKKNDSNW